MTFATAALARITAFSVASCISLWIQEQCSRIFAISTMYGFRPAFSAALRKVASCIRGEQEQTTTPVRCFFTDGFLDSRTVLLRNTYTGNLPREQRPALSPLTSTTFFTSTVAAILLTAMTDKYTDSLHVFSPPDYLLYLRTHLPAAAEEVPDQVSSGISSGAKDSCRLVVPDNQLSCRRQ